MVIEALGDYEGTTNGAAWKKTQDGLTAGQRLIFNGAPELPGNARRLPAAFADCMSIIAEPLKMVEAEHYKSVQGRTFLGVLGLAYQLLVSAWDDCEAGRLTASSHHWRSIFESADYLMAIWWSAEFAAAWTDADLFEKDKAVQAMQIVKDALNGKKQGQGDQRFANRTAQRKSLQVFSHVSEAAASWAFTPAGKGSFFVPEGYNGRDNVLVGMFLVRMANEILAALSETVFDNMPQEWQAACVSIYKTTQAYVTKIERAMGVPITEG